MKPPSADRPAPRGPDARPRSRPPLLPTPRELVDPRGPFLVPLLLLLAARLWAWMLLPLASEDAYITFRYARNLAAGHGLLYNPGARIMGFSSPPWALWSALGYGLLRDPVAWARWTSLAADALTLLLVGTMLARRASAGARAGAWCFTLFFAAWPFFAVVSASGLESASMLCLVALAATLTGRGSALGGPALGALALWRPEGMAAALVLGIGARPRERVVAALLAAAGLTALALYFGSPVPQSVLAKSALYGTPGPWSGRVWWRWLVPVLPGGNAFSGEGAQLFPLAVVLAPALAAGARALWRERRDPLARTVVAALVVWFGYAALGVAYFWWYLAVPLGGIAALAAVGLPAIVRGRGLYAAVALYVLTAWLAGRTFYLGRAQNEYFGFARAGSWLAAHAGPGEKVMLEPIGMVGYAAPLVVVDEIGLVSPAVARRRLRG
ncbi:MAG: hypothetical protein HZC42_01600, partial [Candidatus Eisenbacteria bacterium]|nr:hypothetical protein [Candidatus Eisenbacteria bacterium]